MNFRPGAVFPILSFCQSRNTDTIFRRIVVELKWNKNAETALDQIKRQHYPASIASYTGDILLVGVNYDKKTKVHECRIEKYLKSGEK